MQEIDRNTAAIRRIVRLVAAVVIVYLCGQDFDGEIISSMR